MKEGKKIIASIVRVEGQGSVREGEKKVIMSVCGKGPKESEAGKESENV